MSSAHKDSQRSIITDHHRQQRLALPKSQRRHISEADDFYTYDIVQVGCPSKWFDKTSGTRVYLKDTVALKKQEIGQKLKHMLNECEWKRDKFMIREIHRKNLWKYKPEDYSNELRDGYGKKKFKEVKIVDAFNRQFDSILYPETAGLNQDDTMTPKNNRSKMSSVH